MIAHLFTLSRKKKRLVSIVADLFFLPFAFWLAMSLRLGEVFLPITPEYYYTIGVTCLLSIAAFIRFGLYRAVIRYMSNHATSAILLGVSVSSLALAFSGLAFKASVPR